MIGESKPKTASVNGRLWGARARDWADVQEGMARPVYEAVLERTAVGTGIRYLDVGCGSGMAAQLAAARGAQVSGIDAAEALLAIARLRAIRRQSGCCAGRGTPRDQAGRQPPEGDFHRGDIEELPFANEMFDVVTGFNAFQYAANPVAALAEARRVTKPGGSIVVMTWGNPEGMEAATLIAALRPLMPPPPPGAPGPFALSAEDALRKFASDANLTPVAVFDIESSFEYPDEATAVRGLNAAGVAVRAMENTSEQAVSEAHARAISPFRQSDGRYRIKASFRCLLARP